MGVTKCILNRVQGGLGPSRPEGSGGKSIVGDERPTFRQYTDRGTLELYGWRDRSRIGNGVTSGRKSVGAEVRQGGLFLSTKKSGDPETCTTRNWTTRKKGREGCEIDLVREENIVVTFR